MRTFIAILVCFSAFLPFECVNGEIVKAIKILSPDGSYVPGNLSEMKVFRTKLNEFFSRFRCYFNSQGPCWHGMTFTMT